MDVNETHKKESESLKQVEKAREVKPEQSMTILAAARAAPHDHAAQFHFAAQLLANPDYGAEIN